MAIFVADRHLGLSGWGLGSAHQTPGHQSCWLISIAPLAPPSVALATDLPLACHCMPAWACGWTRRVGGLRGASGLRRAITGPPGSERGANNFNSLPIGRPRARGPVCAWLWVVVWRHRRKPPGRLPSPNCLGVHQIPPCFYPALPTTHNPFRCRLAHRLQPSRQQGSCQGAVHERLRGVGRAVPQEGVCEAGWHGDSVGGAAAGGALGRRDARQERRSVGGQLGRREVGCG